MRQIVVLIALVLAIAESQNTWGITSDREDANHNFVLANKDNPAMAVAGLSLARFGKFEPLLWTERDRIPAITSQYLYKEKPEFYTVPNEGPFDHVWLLGEPEQISTAVQGTVDLAQEIGSYRFQEDNALSAMEAIWVVWIVAGIVFGLWLLLYSRLRISPISIMMQVTWALLGLVTGPLAIWLFKSSYDQVPWMKHGEMAMWQRQGFTPVLAASAMNQGFDGPSMLVISWVTTAIGLPLVIFRGPFFWRKYLNNIIGT